jgi:DNA-binding transcriptional ArsR family regulator
MADKTNKNHRLEVSSDQLKSELVEIKDRISALETISSLAHRPEVEALAKGSIKNDKHKQIMKECEEPRTREYLIDKLGLNGPQALDYHLKPLREDDLLRQHFDDNGIQTFQWSNLFKRLPKKVIREMLGADN